MQLEPGLKKISDLKASEYNPRTINADALMGLKSSIDEFGDLSGIVFNQNTKRLVAGHQRVKALVEQYGDIDISFENNMAFIKTGSLVFPIRFVSWDDKKEKLANLTANNPGIQGQYTEDVDLMKKEIFIDDAEAYKRLHIADIEASKTVKDKGIKSGTTEAGGLFDFILFFSSSDDREYFQDFLNNLKLAYPDGASHGDRVARFLKDIKEKEEKTLDV